MTKVYFADIKTNNSLLDDLGNLYDKALKDIVKKGDIVAVKMHFGEFGNTSFIRSIFIRKIVDKIKEYGGKPFITDSNTLYRGMRHNAVDHLENAVFNGFTYATIGAPLIIADGLLGHSFTEVTINQKNFKTVKIGSAIAEADSIIVVSHFKGHMAAGFGGAIKNLGMGSASRAGKQQQHSDTKPEVDESRCVACKICGKWCPEDAITYPDKAKINYDKCVGCDECVTVCPTSAIGIMWGENRESMQEKMVEYAYGAAKNKKVGYINFIMDVTPDCDCFGKSDAPIIPNLGILASTDPIALDQACLDLVNQQKGLSNSKLENTESKDKFMDLHGFDSTHQLKYGEKIGFGSTKYEIL